MTAQNLWFPGADTAKFTPLGQIRKGQDGAIFHDLVFRFTAKGICSVYQLQTRALLGEFVLDKADVICPHSNAVFFGTEYAAPGDEFPILYSNIYNNYAGRPDPLVGTFCAYRIIREGNHFAFRLVQVIEIGFTHTPLWRSANAEDVRPYGNFVMDSATNSLWAYVMRDENSSTRFFRFQMPKISAGFFDLRFGLPVVTLTEEDIIQQFDSCYVNFMQGAICHDGLIYSTEGFTVPNKRSAIPALRIFDTKTQQQVFHLDLTTVGLTVEPEFTEVYNGQFYYADHDGNFYSVTFGKE